MYSTLLGQLRKGDHIYVLGASQGADQEKTKRFFIKYGSIAYRKGINVKTIFNASARHYVKDMERESKIALQRRFLFKTTPVEVLVAKELTAIVLLKKEPLIISILDKETADSFTTYFEELWNIAQP